MKRKHFRIHFLCESVLDCDYVYDYFAMLPGPYKTGTPNAATALSMYSERLQCFDSNTPRR